MDPKMDEASDEELMVPDIRLTSVHEELCP